MRSKSKKKGDKSLYEYNPEDIDILMKKLDAKRQGMNIIKQIKEENQSAFFQIKSKQIWQNKI